MTTETLRLRAHLSRGVLNAIPEGALVAGPDRRIIAVNDRFVEMCGLEDVDTSAGAPTAPVIDAVERLLPAEEFAALRLRQRQFPRKAEIHFLDGRVIEGTCRPIHAEDHLLGTLWLIEDITETRRRESDLRQHIATLGELARSRAEFVAQTSHELRTPLATVLSFCELLADPSTGPLTSTQRDCVDAVHRNALRMQDMADGLLHAYAAAASAAHDAPAFRPVDLPALVERLVADALPRATAEGVFVTLSCADGPRVTGDAGLLESAVAALLDNAVKFTPEGGTVALTVRPYEAGAGAAEGAGEGPGWEVVVADTGIGVPRAFREEIFTEFVRAPNARRGGFPGTGLGLSVARDAVRLHGGTIAVHSAAGRGSGTIVVVHLPMGGPPGSGAG